jgi:hypothetical protein
MTHIDTMRLALDALKDSINVPCYGGHPKQEAAAAALTAALAEPSEPVAWITKGGTGELWWYQSCTEDGEPNPKDIPLYTHPPVQPSPLTDAEILAIEREWTGYAIGASDAICFARAIEQAIRSKT